MILAEIFLQGLIKDIILNRNAFLYEILAKKIVCVIKVLIIVCILKIASTMIETSEKLNRIL